MSEAFLPEYINLKMGLHPSSETSTNCQTQSFNLFLNFSKVIWTRDGVFATSFSAGLQSVKQRHYPYWVPN